jgi:hypothetical protein
MANYTYMEAISIGFPTVQCHAPGDGTVYEDIVWDAGSPLPSKSTLDEWIAANPIAGADHKVTVLAFRNRFTQAEKVAIDLASIDDPASSAQQRQFAAMLRVMMTDLSVAKYVDLARADTIAGVQALETYGVIGQGRAAQVLSTTIQEIERPLSV